MPRKLTLTEIVQGIDDIYLITESTVALHGDTTTDAALAKGVTTVPVTLETNFDDLDEILIDGSGGVESNEVAGTPAAGSLTTKYKVAFAHNSGATVVEATAFQLGYIEQGGLSISPSRSSTPVEAANSDVPLVYIEGTLSLAGSFSMLSFNGPNILASLGLEDNETGAGTAADPYQITIGPDETKLGTTIFRATGTLHDGQSFRWNMCNARFQSQGSIQVNKSTPAAIPFGIVFTGSVIQFWS